MTVPHLVRLFLEKTMRSESLEPDAHLRMILVHGLPIVADQIFLASIFLPFDQTPVAAVVSGSGSGIVMLQDSDSAADALRDSDGWFASLGLQLSSVPGSLFGESDEMEWSEKAMLPLEVKLTGLHQEIFEWDELWEDTDDNQYGPSMRRSHKTKLQKAVDKAHLAQGNGKLSDNELEEGWAHEMSQLLLCLPYNLQQEVMTDVMKGMGCDLFGELQKKLDQDQSEHVLVDIERITQQVPGSNVNPSGQRPEERAKNKWGMWRSLLCNVIASAFGHALLYVLSKKLASGGAEKNEAVEKSEITNKDRKSWLLEKVLAPLSLSVALSFLRVKVIGPEEIRVAPHYVNNGVVNLVINSASKIAYFAIKEYPGLIPYLGWLPHATSFLIDAIGAVFLWCRGGYQDADIPDA